MTPEERFWAKVDKSDLDGCWLWTGGQNDHGYGLCWFGGKTRIAHRVAYELSVGPIPSGATIDHVRSRGCVSTLCMRPAHLEPVTQRENLHRGDTLQAANAAKTHCDNGHEFSSENTRLAKNRTTITRVCLACRKDVHRRANDRKREARRLARSTREG